MFEQKCGFPRIILYSIVTSMIVMCFGCGDGKIGKATMSLPELGITINAPAGWKFDGRDSGMCTHGDYIGLLLSEPLDGKTFSKAVEAMSKEFGSTVLSRKDLNIGGRTAVQISMDAPNDMKVLRLYLDCGQSIAYVSYAVSKTDYASYEQALLESLASLRIKP